MLLASPCPLTWFEAALARRGPDFNSRMNEAGTSPVGGDDRSREHAALLEAMARGDKNALARLYDHLAKPLYSLAFRVLNDAGESQDVVQDVFLQMWHKAATYDTGRGSVFAWAATLTRNRAIDRVRMRKRRAELLAESAPDLQPAGVGNDPDSAGSLWLREKAGAVRAALTALAPDQQKAIELAFIGGLTQQEIAARLNEPLGTIKARIRRGLLKLRETLPARL
jgi:RNA polymerase sigma-70 factor (ECF subfamily)